MVGEERHVYAKLWKIKVLLIAQLGAWRALQNRLATYVNLADRRIQLASTVCLMCGIQEKILNLKP